MRRTFLLVLSTLLLGSVLSGSAMAAKPVKGGDGVNPHIITDAFSLYVDASGLAANGELKLNWKVAGLGKYGSGYIRSRGWADIYVECTYPRGGGSRGTERTKSIRINEHAIYADASGNATGADVIRPNAVCTNKGTVDYVLVQWGGLGVDLLSLADHSNVIQEANIPGCYNFEMGTSRMEGGAPADLYC